MLLFVYLPVNPDDSVHHMSCFERQMLTGCH